MTRYIQSGLRVLTFTALAGLFAVLVVAMFWAAGAGVQTV